MRALVLVVLAACGGDAFDSSTTALDASADVSEASLAADVGADAPPPPDIGADVAQLRDAPADVAQLVDAGAPDAPKCTTPVYPRPPLPPNASCTNDAGSLASGVWMRAGGNPNVVCYGVPAPAACTDCLEHFTCSCLAANSSFGCANGFVCFDGTNGGAAGDPFVQCAP